MSNLFGLLFDKKFHASFIFVGEKLHSKLCFCQTKISNKNEFDQSIHDSCTSSTDNTIQEFKHTIWQESIPHVLIMSHFSPLQGPVCYYILILCAQLHPHDTHNKTYHTLQILSYIFPNRLSNFWHSFSEGLCHMVSRALVKTSPYVLSDLFVGGLFQHYWLHTVLGITWW